MISENTKVRYIFVVCITVGILIPLINLFFIYPSLTKKILIKNTEDDVMHTAMNLSQMFKQEYGELTTDSIPPDLIKKVEMFQNDHQFIKLKLFSKNGEIIYSSDSKDIGKVDNTPYFRNIAINGNPYSKIVDKDTTSLEGEVVEADVVDTYVPIMRDNTFVGALETYYDITLRNQALKEILLKASVFPFLLMSGGLILTLIILIHLDKSITKQKKADNELRVFTKKLQHSNRELENFAHIASHDLQEPLRKVVAFGDRLISTYTEILDDRGRDYLKRMQSASMRMQTLINDLLTFSRVSTKVQPFKPVDLAKVMSEVVSDLEVRIEKVGGRVEIGDLTTIDADPLQMRQLLQNLVGNALKFITKDTPPVIKINGKVIHGNDGNLPRYASDGNLYELTVADNGIGFEPKYADRIFDVFQRLHGRTEYEGTGMGLSICRRIVDRHSGKIKAKSSPGGGASFTVVLPIKQKRGGNYGYKK